MNRKGDIERMVVRPAAKPATSWHGPIAPYTCSGMDQLMAACSRTMPTQEWVAGHPTASRSNGKPMSRSYSWW